MVIDALPLFKGGQSLSNSNAKKVKLSFEPSSKLGIPMMINQTDTFVPSNRVNFKGIFQMPLFIKRLFVKEVRIKVSDIEEMLEQFEKNLTKKAFNQEIRSSFSRINGILASYVTMGCGTFYRACRDAGDVKAARGELLKAEAEMLDLMDELIEKASLIKPKIPAPKEQILARVLVNKPQNTVTSTDEIGTMIDSLLLKIDDVEGIERILKSYKDIVDEFINEAKRFDADGINAAKVEEVFERVFALHERSKKVYSEFLINHGTS